MEAYENLANAIIMKAVDDYRAALKKLKANPKYLSARNTSKDCERFFLSEWFSQLTELDGSVLMHRLQEEAR